jgi:DNA-binding MarR family transcriptional regulator
MFNETDIRSVDEIFHQLLYKQLKNNCTEEYDQRLQGLSVLDIRIIDVIAGNPEKQIKELLQILEIPNSTLTSAINRFEKRGIVKRVISPDDRRSFIIELTDLGNEIQKAHKKVDYMIARRCLGAMETEEERQMFIRLLTKAVNSI